MPRMRVLAKRDDGRDGVALQADIISPVVGQTLVFDGTQWVNGSTRSIALSLGSPSFSTTNSSYTMASSFIFPGTSTLGAPKSIKAIVSTSGSSAFGRVRVVNGWTVIAESASFNGSTPKIVSLGTLSNLPSAETPLEIQIRRSSGDEDDQVYIRFLGVYW